MMNLKDKLYENKTTRPLILSLEILLGAGAIAGCGPSGQDRANPLYDHPEIINVDGRAIGIYDQSKVFDSFPEEVQNELYDLEIEARQDLILGYGPQKRAASRAKVDSLIKKRDQILRSTRQPVLSEWKYHPANKNTPATVTFKYNRVF